MCVGECFPRGDHLSFEPRFAFEQDDLLHARVHGATNPTKLTVRVFRAEAMLVEQDLRVSYDDVEVNGPGCGVDQTASATVSAP